MTDEERLAEIEARLEAFRAPYSMLAVRRADLADYRWLVDCVRHLTKERDAAWVDGAAWKARCLGHTPAAKEER